MPEPIDLTNLREAVSNYGKALQGLHDTTGMGPAWLACFSAEKRARKALKDAIARAEACELVEP